MPDIGGLLNEAVATGVLDGVARNPTTQFGRPGRRYLGAEILPERLVEQNEYIEDRIQLRSVIANAATRYSPTQKKGGALVSSMRVSLAESDIASELTSRDYDHLQRVVATRPTLEAMAALINFVDATVNIPLVEWIERARWQMIVNAQVTLTGDSEYTETVGYLNPTGHRFAAAGVWSNNTVDPMADVNAAAKVLTDKGFIPGRAFTSRKVANIMANNDKIKTRTSRVTVNTAGQILATTGRVTQAELNALLNADGLPSIELYDLVYRTMTGTGRFLADTVFVMVATTGRDENIDLGDGRIETLQDTLGYVGVGRGAGQQASGRKIRSAFKDDKPPRVEAEGWQTALPVMTEPEAVVVITGIS
jgi:hypothetical protein